MQTDDIKQTSQDAQLSMKEIYELGRELNQKLRDGLISRDDYERRVEELTRE